MYERKTLSLNCGLDLVGEVLYGKWKIRLLWFINEGHKRPSELQRKIPEAFTEGVECAAERTGGARTGYKIDLPGSSSQSRIQPY